MLVLVELGCRFSFQQFIFDVSLHTLSVYTVVLGIPSSDPHHIFYSTLVRCCTAAQ